MLDLNNIKKKPTNLKKGSAKISVKQSSSKQTNLYGLSFSNKTKEDFYFEFQALLKAKLKTTDVLQVLKENSSKQTLKTVIAEIIESMKNGMSISESFQITGKFSNYECLSMKIGEETGELEAIILQLHYYFKRKNHIRKTLAGIVTYPIFLLLSITGAWFFVVNYMLPNVLPMYKANNLDLPIITEILITISNLISDLFYPFIGLLFLSSLILYIFRKDSWFRKISSSILKKTPVVGGLLYKINLTNALQLLLITTQSKGSIEKALQVIKSAIHHYPLENAFDEILTRKKQGVFMFETMQENSLFDTKTITMIKIGEQTNQLEDMLTKLVESSNEDINQVIERIKILLPNVLTFLLAAIILFLLMAAYLPMLNLTNMI